MQPMKKIFQAMLLGGSALAFVAAPAATEVYAQDAAEDVPQYSEGNAPRKPRLDACSETCTPPVCHGGRLNHYGHQTQRLRRIVDKIHVLPRLVDGYDSDFANGIV